LGERVNQVVILSWQFSAIGSRLTAERR